MNRTLSLLMGGLMAAGILWGCRKADEMQLPKLTTTPITDITQNNAMSGGTITVYGDEYITAEGVCWATHPDPMVMDSCTKGMTAGTTFTGAMAHLKAGLTYYVRAYATSKLGTGYGNQISFNTLAAVLPLVEGYPDGVTQTTAKFGCTVTFDGGIATTRGVCWGTMENPTTGDNRLTCGVGMGSYTATITGLSANTSYYVRPYATNAVGTFYGSSIPVRTMYGTVTDIDGNVYQTVLIGDQEWMAENLRVTRYRNGDMIPYVTSQYAWSITTIAGYTYYDLSLENLATYGALYNGYTVIDSRGIAPVGWHVPTADEWTILINYLGGGDVAGGRLKEWGTRHWKSPNAGADNTSGFTALPGGYRSEYKTTNFTQICEIADCWTSNVSVVNTDIMYDRRLSYSIAKVINYKFSKNYGCSIRCVRDAGK